MSVFEMCEVCERMGSSGAEQRSKRNGTSRSWKTGEWLKNKDSLSIFPFAECWRIVGSGKLKRSPKLNFKHGDGPEPFQTQTTPHPRISPNTYQLALSLHFFFSLAMALQKLDMSLDNFAGIILKTLWLHHSPTATAAGRVVQQNRESFSWK